jgi:hypothetical protein
MVSFFESTKRMGSSHAVFSSSEIFFSITNLAIYEGISTTLVYEVQQLSQTSCKVALTSVSVHNKEYASKDCTLSAPETQSSSIFGN